MFPVYAHICFALFILKFLNLIVNEKSTGRHMTRLVHIKKCQNQSIVSPL